MLEVVKYLVERGADINAEDEDGETAQDAASNHGSWKYQYSKCSLNTIIRAESESAFDNQKYLKLLKPI